MFREPEEEKVVETYRLASAMTDYDEVNMDIQEGYGAKYTIGILFVQF